jgi:hypothetical protein
MSAAGPLPSNCLASAIARITGAFLFGFGGAIVAAPVEVYREGPEFCPRDRKPDAPALTQAAAVERARSLLPRGFCALSRFVAGCDVESEFVEGTWRILLHQFQLRGYRHDQRGLAHTYVILDPVGNCIANIPGTEVGSRE